MRFSTLLIPSRTPPDPAPLRLFVYGTLKRGCYGFEQYCQGCCSLQPAAVRGRVVDRPEGYPTLFIPPEDVLAIGSEDILRDLALPWRYEPVQAASFPALEPPWRFVLGEVLEFKDPESRLRVFDEFEDFLPDDKSCYCRVLAPVITGKTVSAAWLYASPHSPRFQQDHGCQTGGG
ncbi:gamma-glutamylcyclotransferase [Megalodesulfovibrio paquesii]